MEYFHLSLGRQQRLASESTSQLSVLSVGREGHLGGRPTSSAVQTAEPNGCRALGTSAEVPGADRKGRKSSTSPSLKNEVGWDSEVFVTLHFAVYLHSGCFQVRRQNILRLAGWAALGEESKSPAQLSSPGMCVPPDVRFSSHCLSKSLRLALR